MSQKIENVQDGNQDQYHSQNTQFRGQLWKQSLHKILNIFIKFLSSKIVKHTLIIGFCIILILLVLVKEKGEYLDAMKWKQQKGIPYQSMVKFLNYRKLKNGPNKQLPKQQYDKLAKQQYDYYQKKYNISHYRHQIPFCIVVSSYKNNADNRIPNNLNSIFTQNYSNYHVVYYDDASGDGTYDAVLQYLKTIPTHLRQKIEVIKNQKNRFALANYVDAAYQRCKPQQIYLIVDGDDELIGMQVLNLYNAIFQKTGPFFVYSSYIDSRGFIGYPKSFHPKVKRQNLYRKAPWSAGHLQGFYTELFKRIKSKDLIDPKTEYYFAVSHDCVVIFPMLELAHTRVQFVPELTYYYNVGTGLNDQVVRGSEMIRTQQTVRTFPVYQHLIELFPHSHD